MTDRWQHGLVVNVDDFSAGTADDRRQRASGHGQLRGRNQRLIEFDFRELANDLDDGTLTRRQRLDAHDSRRNYDLTIAAEVRSESVGHIPLAETSRRAARQLSVQLVVQLK